jgi:hypothetical protein
MAVRNREYHLRSNKWTTVAKNFSFRSRYVCAEVWAPRVASWRRISIFPGYGHFRRYLSAHLPFGIIQVKFRENRTCTVRVGDNRAEAKPEHFPD